MAALKRSIEKPGEAGEGRARRRRRAQERRPRKPAAKKAPPKPRRRGSGREVAAPPPNGEGDHAKAGEGLAADGAPPPAFGGDPSAVRRGWPRKVADPLETYNRKRDFAKTDGAARQAAAKLAWGHGDGFMVQKHDATRLHYDLRLELDGMMKSWAVPNGPSLDPADKRLAVRTEDHPMSYATFEGTIPKGEYGGGTVMLWDRGTWTPEPGKDPRKTLEAGPSPLHPRRRADEGRVGHVPAEAARRARRTRTGCSRR